MAKINSCKYSALVAQLGHGGPINSLEYEWLALQTGVTSGLKLNEQWCLLLNNLGYTGKLPEMQIQSWQDQGWTGNKWNELANQFWCTGGGTYGPTVIIVDNTPVPSCSYVDPAASCTAAGTYTANDNGFTNPADTWLWTIEPPVVGVDLTDATLKTCTVTTPNGDADISFNLKVVATDSVSTDTANRTTAYLHKHTNATVAPVFIGPNVNDVQFVVNVAIGTFSFAPVFTGDALVFTEIGTWPLGLSMDAAGDLTGTPTQIETQAMQVQATNSKGTAITNVFNVEIIASAQSAAINTVQNGTCSYEYPATDCTTVNGQYTVVPTGFTQPPDTWLWEISTQSPSGTATITNGQGTATADINTTASDSPAETFTMRCTVSNSVTLEQAIALLQTTHVHTDNTTPISNIQITEDQAGACTYTPSTLLDGLIAWYGLEETGANARIDSHNSYDLTPAGGVLPSTTAGVNLLANDFTSSTTSRLFSNDAIFIPAGDFTFSLWVRFDLTNFNDGVLSKNQPVGAECNYNLWTSAAGTLRWSMKNNTGTAYGPTTPIVADQWYHLVVSYNATTKEISMVVDDGTPLTDTLVGDWDNMTNTEPFMIGNYTDSGTNGLPGFIDEVAHWSRLLTPAEITELATGIGYPG